MKPGMKSITLKNRRLATTGHDPFIRRAWAAVLMVLLLGSLAGPCVAQSPRDTPARVMQRGSDLMTAKQFEQAAAMYASVVETAEPGSTLQAQAIYRLGLAQQRMKRYEQAQANYERALRIDVLSPQEAAEVRNEAGYCDLARNRHEDALKWFDQVVTDPKASPVTVSVSNLYASTAHLQIDRKTGSREHVDDAIECLVRVTEQTDTDPHYVASAWVRLGSLYASQDQFDQARDAYRQALKVSETGSRASRARSELAELELRAQADSALFMPPWTVSVSEHDALLHWIAKGDVAAASITFNDPQVRAQVQRVSEIEPGYFLYRAQVTGLKPGQQYTFTASAGDARAASAFHTPSSSMEALTFCVLGDTQTRAHVHSPIAELIARQEPRFVLHAGDCVERGNDFLQWQTQLIGPARPYLRKAPLYPARGNHDNGPYFPQLFNLIPDQHYSVNHGLVHAVFLDSFGPGASREARPAQAKWLDEVLSASSAPWKVIVVHDPMVNGDLYNAWWGLEEFMPVIEKHGVAAVFSGHHHRYRRFLPLHPPGKPEAGGIWHITTGGAGGGLSGMTYTPLTVDTQLIHHFVRVDVDATTMRMTVIDLHGNTLDAFTLQRDAQGKVYSSSEQPVDRAAAQGIIQLYSHLAFSRHEPDLIETRWQDGHLVIDFDHLRQGVMPTAAMPVDFAIRIEAGADTQWTVPMQTLALRDVRKLQIKATPPGGDILKPLSLTLTPLLGQRELIARTFKINVVSNQLATQPQTMEVKP